MNLFLRAFKRLWLSDENTGHELLVDDVTITFEEAAARRGKEQEVEETEFDALNQLVTALSRSAGQPEDPLFIAFADLMAKSCGYNGTEGEEEEEEGNFGLFGKS